MPSSNYLRGKIIDATLRNVPYTSPATVYVSLHTSDPTPVGTPGTEISAGWYARQPVVFSAQSTAGQTSNSGTVTYNAVTNGPIQATHFAIWDASTLGNMLYFGPLSATKTFSTTDVPSWLASQIALNAA